MRKQHPPCDVCGCQNVVNLANAIADAVIRRQEFEERVDAELAADHIRGPFHGGQHPDCIVCHPELIKQRATGPYTKETTG